MAGAVAEVATTTTAAAMTTTVEAMVVMAMVIRHVVGIVAGVLREAGAALMVAVVEGHISRACQQVNQESLVDCR